MLKYEQNQQQQDNQGWKEKIQEIVDFKSSKLDVTKRQKQMMINVYQKHRHVISNISGKIKSYQCKLRIREGVTFNR